MTSEQRSYRLLLLLLVAYFGEPALALLFNVPSTTRQQLAIFVMGTALLELFPPRVYVYTALGTTLLLMYMVGKNPDSIAVFPLSYTVYGLIISAVLAVCAAVWRERKHRL